MNGDSLSLLVAIALAGGLLALSAARLFLQRRERWLARQRLLKRAGLEVELAPEEPKSGQRFACTLGLMLAPSKPQEIQAARERLGLAGFRHEEHLGIYYCVKLVPALLLAMVNTGLWLRGWLDPRLAFALPVIALYLPDLALRLLAQRRLQQVNLALPDFIDLCNICMSAGLSWMVSVRRVSDELAHVHPAICREFRYMLDQTQTGLPRTEALKQLARRNPTKDIQHLVQVLIQNERLGSSISASLADFSRRVYTEREQLMEEKAGKVSAKMALVVAPFMLLPFVLLLVGEQVVKLLRGF